MNLISKLRKNLLYFFLTLPLILIGYELLMTLATGNRGWTFLLLGQITIVPFLYIFIAYFVNKLTYTFFGNIMIVTLTVITVIVLPTLILQLSKDLYK